MRILLALALMAGTAFPAGLPTLDVPGYRKMLAAQKGKVVLVNFWATYCVPCRKEMPALVQLQAAYKAKGFLLVTISADEPEDADRAAEFLSVSKVPPPAYLRKAESDEAFINAIEPKWSGALPASILYDRAGNKVRTFTGEADLKILEAEIRKLL